MKQTIKTILTEMANCKSSDTLRLRIAPALQSYPKIKLSECELFQGDLKDLTQTNMDKLAAQLHTEGFVFPLYIWKDKKGKNHILDGHQRFHTITEWYGKETELPYTPIEAKNKDRAKKLLLAKNSEFGKMTLDGYQQFTADLPQVILDEVAFSTTFNEDWGKPFFDYNEEAKEADNSKSTDYSDKNKEIDVSTFGDKMILKLEYSEEEYHEVKGMLSEIGMTAEAALYNYLFPKE